MSETTAVAAALDTLNDDSVIRFLKRNLLLFDRIVVADELGHSPFAKLRSRAQLEAEWLADRGLLMPGIRDPTEPFRALLQSMSPDDRVHVKDLVMRGRAATIALKDVEGTAVGDLSPALLETYLTSTGNSAHLTALMLNRQGADAVAVLPVIGRKVFSPSSESRGVTVSRIVLEAMPVPDDSVPWEAILDFRSDPESRGHLIALKHWMNEMGASTKTAKEIADELEYLLHRYEEHMRINRMKYERGVIETIVTTAAGVAEDLVRLRFGTAVRSLFSVTKDRIELLQAQQAAPGRDLVFLIDAHRRFAK